MEKYIVSYDELDDYLKKFGSMVKFVFFMDKQVGDCPPNSFILIIEEEKKELKAKARKK